MSTRPPSPKKVSFADVATNARVSTNVVSRTVRGNPEIADAMRARISALLDEMEYRPNYAARALISRKTGVLRVLLAASMFHGHDKVLLSILNASSKAGYHISLSSAYRPDGALHTQVASFGVDGVVILASQNPSVELAAEIGKGIPTCLLLSSEKSLEGISTASIDDVRGPRLAAEHLLRQGVSGVTHTTEPRDWSDVVMRRQGFAQACEEVDVESQVIKSFPWSAHDGYDAACSLSHLPQTPQRVNDRLALGAMRLIHEHDAKVPGDVRVVGFDDVDGADCYTPPLTAIRQPFDRLGRVGVRLVHSLVKGNRAEDVTIDPEPVIRAGPTL